MHDFRQPQRQSPVGVLIMFLDTLREYIRALWPILVVMLLKGDTINRLLYVGALIGFLVFLGIAAYLRYRKFTFYIDEDQEEFIVTTGIFSTTRTSIKLEKIQQVNINQSLIQRIIGVYELEIDTAGSSDKEAKIRAVSHPLASALKERLLEERNRLEEITSNEPHEEESSAFIKISLASLIKTGITSNYIRTVGVIVAFFLTMLDNIMRWGDAGEEFDIDSYVDYTIIMQSIFALIILFVVAVLVINLVRTVVRFYNFTIDRQNKSLLLSFGLLNTRNTIIRPERVQITAIIQNYFQRKMDVLRMKIRQAGDLDSRKTQIEIPGCNQTEHLAILQLLYGCNPEEGIMLMPNFRKLVFSIFLAIVLPLSGFFYVSSKLDEPQELIYLPIIYTVFVGFLLWFGFRNNRMYVTDRFVIIRSGAWDITREIVETHKIQAITTSQLFWHKSLNIGTLKLHTAGGTVSFSLGNFEIIREYVNRWLYKIESSDANWM